MRNHHKLRAIELADQLALAVYKETATFRQSEQFRLTSQLRRAAVSVPSNIVEGCAKSSEADYIRFLDIAYGSSCEVQYQLSLSRRLDFISEEAYKSIDAKAVETSKVLGGLIHSLRGQT